MQIRRKDLPRVSKTFKTQAAAKTWAARKENELESDFVSPVPKKRKLSELIEKYREEVTPRKRATRAELGRLKMLEKELGDLYTQDLTAQRIVEYHRWRSEVSKDAARRDLVTLKLVLDAAVALWDLVLPENPVPVAKKMLRLRGEHHKARARDRRLRKGELRRLLKASSPDLRKIIIWAIESGMRRGEIADIEITDRKMNVLTIPRTKTDIERTIPVTRHMDRCWPLPKLHPDSISQAFKRACDRANIVGLTFHDLRHEATSRLFEKGLQLHEVAAITGHADWSSLKRYTHPDPIKLGEKLR